MTSMVKKVRMFCEEEEGSITESIAVGAVGILVAAVVMSAMTTAVQGSGGLTDMVKALFKGGSGGIGSFLGF